MAGRPIECDRKEATRKATQHFWRKGYAHTSVADLVEETGLNRFCLYGEFKGKKGLFLKSCQLYSESCRANLLKPLVEAKDPETGLRESFGHVITRLLDTSNPNGCMMIDSLAGDAGKDADIRRALQCHFSAWEFAFAEVLHRAAGKSAKPAGTKAGASILLNTMLGMSNYARLHPQKESLEAIANAAIKTALATARGK
ncbi:TetR/AcrR family transcriptional regulator [Pedosphaera parvula]|uniref:Transcriptional regulator, TetR family n=1 Tax=Pedosphaera parvula (strain Ellin514) TaxID=320771 RepID=B9XKM0_PEDPL|nr:TetR family transcriptional regulator [Pedosphaera parvula]EEF59690.1 transcriptional regulator, TetR family [Pedosphaera parvula Ellin514]